jgi:hypothetical protein
MKLLVVAALYQFVELPDYQALVVYFWITAWSMSDRTLCGG